MYLLNNYQISKHVTDHQSSYLSIENYNEDSLQHTSYYFRLGLEFSRFDDEGVEIKLEIKESDPYLTIEPNEYVIIESHEDFHLSDKVKGTIGSLSDMIYKGLQINYSPFIDPLYKGQIKVGIKNLLNKQTKIKIGEKIGKVSFYDISDTYPITIVRGSKQESLFSKRAMSDGPKYPDEDKLEKELYKKKSWSSN